MNLLQLPQMVFTAHGGWDEIERTRPDKRQMFFEYALPMSLLPPAMILFAADGLGATRFPDIPYSLWLLSALLFLVLELLSVPLMAKVIRAVARSSGAPATEHDAFMIATLAPIPLWLSSLVLLQDQVWLIFAVPLLLLIATASLIRHGVERMFRVSEPVRADEISFVVISFGILVWMALLASVLLPLLASR